MTGLPLMKTPEVTPKKMHHTMKPASESVIASQHQRRMATSAVATVTHRAAPTLLKMRAGRMRPKALAALMITTSSTAELVDMPSFMRAYWGMKKSGIQ